MRVVPPAEFQAMLVRAMRQLPVAMQPKHVEAAALLLVSRPPLDRLGITIGEAMDFRDLNPP